MSEVSREEFEELKELVNDIKFWQQGIHFSNDNLEIICAREQISGKKYIELNELLNKYNASIVAKLQVNKSNFEKELEEICGFKGHNFGELVAEAYLNGKSLVYDEFYKNK